MKTTVNREEIEKFSIMADQWWDEDGPFKPLHLLNPTRISYIRDSVSLHFGSMHHLSLLDIGCGGGLLSEPMARLGAKVTAIDASEKNIRIASLHAEKEGLDIYYKHSSAEELTEAGARFDIVLAMEIIEHVDDVGLFIESLAKLVKKDGMVFIATINRTLQSLLLAKIGAEYILRWLPKGTHDWNKFLTPAEISNYLRQNNMEIKEMTGITYNPFKNSWSLSKNLAVNYIITACNSD